MLKSVLVCTALAFVTFAQNIALGADEWLTRLTPSITQRHTHTAVWTGDSMIVWGGYSGSANLNSGAIFNPNSNTWSPVSTVNAPSARS